MIKSILLSITFGNIIREGFVPSYIWIIGAVGLIFTCFNLFRLFAEARQPLTLNPNIKIRQSPKEDKLYNSYLSLKNQPISMEEAYEICLNSYQTILVNKNIRLILLGIGLTIIPIIYLVSEWIILNHKWGDFIFILIGASILPISWTIAFARSIYILIFYGLLLNWIIYAITFSGKDLPPDTLLWFLIIINFISFIVLFNINENEKKVNTQKGKSNHNSILGMCFTAVLTIFVLGAIRYLLPFVGSFTILLVIPAILMLCIIPKIGCWASFFAIPMLITSSIVEKKFLIFPNSLLVSCFMGFDIALFLNILVIPAQVKKRLDQILENFNIPQPDYPTFPCQNCQTSMQYISNSEIDNYLSYPEQIAHSLDSMEYFAWYCPQCYPSAQEIHLRGYFRGNRYSNKDSWFEDCPVCQERTMICHQTLAREYLSNFMGIKSNNKEFNVERECACCNLIDSRILTSRRIL